MSLSSPISPVQDVSASRGVLWDLDGTLIETGQLHYQAWQETLTVYGRALSWEEFSSSFGQRNDTVIPLWLGPDISSNEMAEISEAKEACFRRLLREQGVDPLPGVEHWLQALRDAGWRQALATMTPRANIETIFAVTGLGGYFNVVVTGDDVQNGKPAPDVFLRAAADLHLGPTRCVVVEDSPAGIAAARQAGMPVIGVSARNGLNADILVPSLLDLPNQAFEGLVS